MIMKTAYKDAILRVARETDVKLTLHEMQCTTCIWGVSLFTLREWMIELGFNTGAETYEDWIPQENVPAPKVETTVEVEDLF